MAPQPIPIRRTRPAVDRRSLPRLAAIAGLWTIAAAFLPAPPAAAAVDRLPDLRMASIRDLRIQVTASGRRLLRFTTILTNTGTGPLELHASRNSVAEKSMRVTQRIYNTAGGFRTVATRAVGRYAGDGHNHWHVQRVATYDLLTPDRRFLRRAAKLGFCFFDTTHSYPRMRGSPARQRYFQGRCGVRSSRAVSMGLSVGWGDNYPWNFAYQWIDVSRLAAGSYTIRAVADLDNNYRERSETNNCAYVRIVIPARGQPRILGRGTNCLGWVAPGTRPAPTPTPSPTPTPTEAPTEAPTPTPTAAADG
ncbi:MAG TPA: lysyl oxidase family protein [Candidatus Limnocylindrales bacterium]